MMNHRKLFACCCCAAFLLNPARGAWENITRENLPQAAKVGKPDFQLAFAPDFVACDIPRRFMVELEFPQGFVPTQVTGDDAVRLVGTRDLEQKLNGKPARKLRRFYFESRRPADPARIEIQSANGKLVVPVVVWGYEELRQSRKINGMTFPRRYPLGETLPYVKTRQVFPPDPALRATDPIRFGGFVAKRIHFNEPVMARDYTMQEVWDFGPDTSFTVRKPFPGPADPRHGDRIYRASGDPFYPYKMIPPLPGKPGKYFLISPVDGKTVPDNDWGSNDFSGTTVDDGLNGAEFNNQRHYYVGVIAVMRGLLLYDLVAQTAALYAKTGDAHYADLALAGLCRIAVEHNMLATLAQNRRSHVCIDRNRKLVEAVPFEFLGNTGFFIDGIWTTAEVNRMALAYDQLFPAISDRAPVIDFLKKKNFPVRNATELKRFIEENVFLTYLQGQLDGICKSNYPQAPRAFGTIARVLDYPDTRFVDKLYRDGLGEKMFLGLFWRDAVKDESPGGYNGRGLSIFHELFSVADALVAAHPELYNRERYPNLTRNRRFLTGALAQIKHNTTPYTQIVIGDGPALNTFKSAKRYSRRYTGDETPEFFETVYRDFPTPELAWALLHTEGYRPRANPSRAELTAMAAKLPADWRARADVITGPGISLLRGGSGDAERTLYSHYGWFFHGHDSTMGLYLDALNSRLVTGWGYPAKLDAWYYNWMGNNTGRHFPAMKSQGTIPRRWSAAEGDLFGSNDYTVTAGSVQAMKNRGSFVATDLKAPLNSSVFTPSTEHGQNRLQLMVNVTPDKFYLADFYTMRGGREHWRSFGTLDGPVTVRNLPLQKQPAGTLAGPDVPYNDARWIKDNGGEGSVLGFTRIRNVERAPIRDNTPFEAVWQLNNSDNAYLRLLSLAPGDGEAALGDAADHHQIYPMVRRMLFWRHQPQPGRDSRVFNLIETGRGKMLIENAERLPLQGDSSSGAVAARIRLATGETDYLLLADRPGSYRVELPEGMLTLDGSAGVVRIRDGKTTLHLLHGTRLTYGEATLAQPAAAINGKITAVDHSDWSMDITPAVSDPSSLNGRFVNIDRHGVRFTLQILRAENRNGATRLFLDCPSLADHFTVTGHASGVLRVEAREKRGSITDMQYRLAGMELTGRSGRRYICDLRLPAGNALRLRSADAEALAPAVLQQEFPAGSKVDLYEYTPGMSVEIPLALTNEKGGR